MIHFRLFNWRVVARVHRIRKVPSSDLDRANVIVCGDVEARMLADSERERHEYEVMSDLYAKVGGEVDGVIEACHVSTGESGSEYARRQAHKNVVEFLREIRDIAWRMTDQPPAVGTEGG